jgi:acyl-CoA thioester hydrolase
MAKPYFAVRDGQPPSLCVEVERRVRFEEVDSIGIVWHGRYASFFEEARDALGDRYGIGYMAFYENGILVPLKKLHVDFHLPLKLREIMRIEAVLHYTEAARMNYAFRIHNEEGDLCTTGYTVQMMLDADRNLCMIPPRFYAAFLERWKAGDLHESH